MGSTLAIVLKKTVQLFPKKTTFLGNLKNFFGKH